MLTEIEDICKKLQDDYNGDVLEEANENIKEIFKQIAEKYKGEKKGNIPLLNIVHNHFNGVLPNDKYISGPFCLSYHTSEEYNMKVYIFGETHGTKGTCIELGDEIFLSSAGVSEYLQNVFLNSDKFIDFYLEDQLFSTRRRDRGSQSLLHLRYDFNYCLNPNKRKNCKFKTVRTHFVDVRDIEKEKKYHPTNPLGKLESDLKKYGFKIPDESEEVLRELGALKTFESVAKYIIKETLKIPIIKKELDRCYLSLEFVISNFYEIILERISSRFGMENWITIFTTKEYLIALRALLVRFQVFMVDLYTISRMFKRFKKKNELDYLPEKPKYIIYYAGNYHSTNVRMFLEKLKFKTEFYRESNKKCLDMTGIKLDFK